ncbi:MAG: hypothetical protein WCV62_00090 [Candidatus Peribacteraceae bacterium]
MTGLFPEGDYTVLREKRSRPMASTFSQLKADELPRRTEDHTVPSNVCAELEQHIHDVCSGYYTPERAFLAGLVQQIPQISEEARRMAVSVYPGPDTVSRMEKEEERELRRQNRNKRVHTEERRRLAMERLEQRKKSTGIAGVFLKVRKALGGLFKKD